MIKNRVKIVRSSEDGVTMLQFAVVFPILIFIIIFVIDICRFFAVQAVLNKAAEEGLTVATKIANFDMDIEGLSATDQDYIQFSEARRRIIEAASRLPLDTLLSDAETESSMQLFNIVTTDDELAGGDPVVLNSVAAVIRPRDQVFYQYKDRYAETVEQRLISHKTYPKDVDAADQPSVETLLKSHPISVELRARVDMINPFISSLIVEGTAVGYREDVPRGPFGVINGAPVPTPAPTPIVSPTNTPTPIPTPTVTPNWICTPNWEDCSRLNDAQNRKHCPKNQTSGFFGGGACLCAPCIDPATGSGGGV